MRELFEHDELCYLRGHRYIAGIDEAGRGPLAGPVVAAAVVLSRDTYIEGVNDSKRLSEGKRRKLFFEIVCKALDIGVGIVEHDRIDRINILNASKHAMIKAVEDLNKTPDFLLTDAVKLTSLNISQESIIRGDSKSAAIAAASIIAKVVRDSLMYSYHDQYPQYGFDSHKGYCTRKHVERLHIHGPCPIHRMSFKPVSSLLLF